MRIASVILLFTAIFLGCQKDPLPDLINDEIVVHGILQQFADTQYISLSRVTALGESGAAIAVRNASIEVISMDQSFVFEPLPGVDGRYFNSNLEVIPNAVYQLKVVSGDSEVKSTILAPPSLDVTSGALDNISVDPSNTGNTVLSVEWISVEENPVLLDLIVPNDASNTEIEYPGSNGGYFETSYNLPITTDGVHILDYDFTHFGNQTIRFFRVSEEYQRLLEYPPNTLTFNALSFDDNVSGGSGLFTAVTIDQLSFTVLEE